MEALQAKELQSVLDAEALAILWILRPLVILRDNEENHIDSFVKCRLIENHDVPCGALYVMVKDASVWESTT